MNKLEEFEQKLGSMALELEVMKAEAVKDEAVEREPEIPVGTLCWFWDGVNSNVNINTYNGPSALPNDEIRHLSESGYTWVNARIANDIPGCMIWEKHDGGPCPVGADVYVVTYCASLPVDRRLFTGAARDRTWSVATAYAIINKAEWME